jgi:hypothetical protein
MAGRILNRRELRKQADEAEARESSQAPEADDEIDDAGDAGVAKDKRSRPAKAKAPAAKARKPRKPKAAPRMRVRWGVFDGSMKQVAIFDYNQRAAADEKAAELAAKKNSAFFLQMVKEPMPEPASRDAPSLEAR